MRTSKAGLMIIAFGLFLMLCPAAVFALYIPVNFIPLFLNPITLALFAFGAVFVSLGIYFYVIGKRQV
ncbi:MAG TPA: hypothetical protein VJP79_00950 [Nitrososphaera sp.]|nr:hypothetical protein [Nitrososphaera sp.]